jgi:hypothetical protein
MLCERSSDMAQLAAPLPFLGIYTVPLFTNG